MIKKIETIFDPLFSLFGNQIFWLLLWAGGVLFFLDKYFVLSILLFISGLSRFYLAVKEEYLKNKNGN